MDGCTANQKHYCRVYGRDNCTSCSMYSPPVAEKNLKKEKEKK